MKPLFTNWQRGYAWLVRMAQSDAVLAGLVIALIAVMVVLSKNA